ncbi:glycerol-3-phosphate dehydrogenase [NAD(P)+] [Mycoplasmopsis californica HAZ160_1]|uniref:Glycerol-3-phosphate dehydrogenase n=1 Tax=Mycoplasmopsis californica HAZ160_1 TaxID=1397850 RepID=A0AAT9F7N3_9BACT|nr:NAD(P)H-dependent glycerol-3-phosphate dehydrogenase [Mycoplasmopsis californica]BAP00915.1 glycerol-3-phosphate dehydrogenase [NAD(P)+] [Mycoplasmopsis californica HAZ160_1]BBG40777.1 glycerol-3-phosphate dehydrogenase [NAD(P)+] [Mycoplasmopsis californica]BBG41371.1 glycerol-3-phosphate dehydrogenase [NAD(P)+] [Mycoplasmopsis californica]BBG41964.1 glycerol-3-phosphate dehydrogenase [NAD(P)+] [Mycoplasmopsis californica]BBG42550.1 glycerol-3-phosphate dehydrogenase [NAD(P)+] [Mycoplasmops
MSRNFVMLGTGAWSSALASMLSKNGHKIKMWGIDKSEILDINKGVNTKYFASSKFNNPENIEATSDLKYALENVDIIVVAVPTPVISSVLTQVKTHLGNRKISIINVAKGINPETKEFFSAVIKNAIGSNLIDICSVIGPSFAIDVFNNKMTMVNAVGENIEFLTKITNYFTTSSFKLIPNTDEKASETFSALKNVLAIGMGIASGLFDSQNLLPALISLGLKEIFQIAKFLSPETSDTVGYELAAVGDIVLTCLNPTSRNFSFGLEIAKNGVQKAIAMNVKTVEGYNTAKILEKILQNKKAPEAPFISNIISVLLHNLNPREILNFI